MLSNSYLQAILTGESSTVAKSCEPTLTPKAVYQDKTCMLFSVRMPQGLLAVAGLCSKATTCDTSERKVQHNFMAMLALVILLPETQVARCQPAALSWAKVRPSACREQWSQQAERTLLSWALGSAQPLARSGASL